MLTIILTLLLAAIILAALLLRAAYMQVPLRELERRSIQGDAHARLLLKAVKYGGSLEVLLWGVIGVGYATLSLTLEAIAPLWLTFMLVATFVWLGFFLLPEVQLSSIRKMLAKWSTPTIVKVLQYIDPVLRFLGALVDKLRSAPHTGLYEKEDLLGLLEKQHTQKDNRMTDEELQLAYHVLTFGEKLVRSYMTSRKLVKYVSPEDAVGPILLSELHESGHAQFPVYDDAQGKIVGTLYLRDIIHVRAGGKIRDYMSQAVYYVRDDAVLAQVLHAFFATQHSLFIVVNKFEKVVGIITIKDVIENMMGGKIVDDFDRYDDIRSVAAGITIASTMNENELQKPVEAIDQ